MTLTTKDLFWEKMEELFRTIGVPHPSHGDDWDTCLPYIDRAIKVAQAKNDVINKHRLLSEEDGA